MLLLYRFWLTEICKPCPTRNKTRDQQIALPTTLTLLFFLHFWYSTSKRHSRHFRTLRLAILLVTSFFPSLLIWKEFNSHNFVVTFHFTRFTTCFLSSRGRLLNSHKHSWLIGDSSLWVLPFNFTKHSLNAKHFYFIHYPIRCYHFRSKWTREQWQWRGTPHFPKL